MRAERLAGLAAGLFILIFVSALIWRNQEFATPDLARAMRILLSLGVGILGGTIPGFLNVAHNFQGFAIRAGGALALFVLTLFGLPAVEALKLKNPEVAVSSIPQIDIRTSVAPDRPDTERLQAGTVVTVPVSIRNIAEPARSAFLDSMTVEVALPGGREEFVWQYFVNMHEEAYGVWLAIEGDATPRAIRSGEVVNLEVLHRGRRHVAWRDMIQYILASDREVGEAEISFKFGDDRRSLLCRYDLARWKTEVQAFTKKTGRAPGRVTMNCLGPAA